MAVDRIDRIIADYERGALTDASAFLEILIAAGEGDANALDGRLTPELRELVSRDIAGANPNEVRIVESSCGTSLAEAHAADLRRREDIMRRGLVALQRLTSDRNDSCTVKGPPPGGRGGGRNLHGAGGSVGGAERMKEEG